ncbi:hypothetical protein [Kineosporia babensis]|uniref:TIR domain-containing protein n=1 Tax=Kineosporia babensis TaxID=499548 RepID=A0A9X1NIP8_9ACTN|nr:hypothetical protein [Kineosporia babensis]MCD5315772.1 hypothetical protein [Kineosporia babensis]
MHNIFLCYANLRLVEARQLRQDLVQLGQSVWMDKPSSLSDRETSIEALGLPPGLQHQKVIFEAIAESAAFLVHDSLPLRNSSYCTSEFEYARRLGIRVAVITDPLLPDDHWDWSWVMRADREALQALTDLLDERLDLALAHLRLSAEMDRGSAEQTSRVRRVLSPAARHRLADAKMLLAAEVALNAPRISDAQRGHALRVVDHERSRIQDRRRLGIAAVGLILAAVVGTLFFLRAEGRHQDEARSDQARASSLRFARQATDLLGSDTEAALTAARHALSLDNKVTTRETLQRVLSRREISVLRPIPIRNYSSGAVSADGSRLVFNYGRGLVVLDASGTLLGDLPLSSPIGSQQVTFVSPTQVLAVLRDSGRLVSIDLGTEAVTQLSDREVTAFAQGSEGRIWWADEEGTVGFVDSSGEEVPVLGDQGTVLALEPGPELLTLLTDDDVVRRFSVQGEQLTLTWETDLATIRTPPARTESPDSPEMWRTVRNLGQIESVRNSLRAPMLLPCGDRTQVMLSRRQSLWQTVHVELDAQGRPTSPFSSGSSMWGAACLPTGNAFGIGIMNRAVTSLPSSGWVPVGVSRPSDSNAFSTVATRDGGSPVAIAYSSGRIEILAQGAPLSRSVGGAMSAAVLPGDQVLLQMLNGDLFAVSLDSRVPATAVGHLADPLSPLVVATSRGAIGFAGNAVHQLGPKGIIRTWPQGGAVKGITSTAEGDRVVATLADRSLKVIDLADGHQTSLSSPDTPAGDVLTSVAMDGDHFYGITDRGTVIHAAATDGRLLRSIEGVATSVCVTPQHRVVVVGSDGSVRLFSSSLEQEAIKEVSAQPQSLQCNRLTGDVMVQAELGAVALSGRNLELRQVVPDARGELQISPEGTRAISFVPFERSHSGTVVDMTTLRSRASKGDPVPAPGAISISSETQDTLAQLATWRPLG